MSCCDLAQQSQQPFSGYTKAGRMHHQTLETAVLAPVTYHRFDV